MSTHSLYARPRSLDLLSLLTLLARNGLLLVSTLVLGVCAPALGGWQPDIVLTGSMEPSVSPGHVLLIAEVAPEELRPGQVLLVDDPVRPGQLVSHRLVSISPDGALVLRGDANNEADSTPVDVAAVHGVARLVIPYIGLPRVLVETGNPLGALALAVALFGMTLLAARPLPQAAGQPQSREPLPRPVVAAVGCVTVLPADVPRRLSFRLAGATS